MRPGLPHTHSGFARQFPKAQIEGSASIEFTILIPCLNEAETLAIQAVSASFFMSVLGLKTASRRPPAA